MNREAGDKVLKLLIVLRLRIGSYVLPVKIVIDQVVRHVYPDEKTLTFWDIFRGGDESKWHTKKVKFPGLLTEW
jgi:hypothetical protein